MRAAGSRWWEVVANRRRVGEHPRWCRHNNQPLKITYFVEGGYRNARCLRCGIVGPAVWGDAQTARLLLLAGPHKTETAYST
jgi:hypothetical protein